MGYGSPLFVGRFLGESLQQSKKDCLSRQENRLRKEFCHVLISKQRCSFTWWCEGWTELCLSACVIKRSFLANKSYVLFMIKRSSTNKLYHPMTLICWDRQLHLPTHSISPLFCLLVLGGLVPSVLLYSSIHLVEDSQKFLVIVTYFTTLSFSHHFCHFCDGSFHRFANY